MNRSAVSERCPHRQSEALTNRDAEINGRWKPRHTHSLRLASLICLLGLLVALSLYAFSPIPLFSAFSRSQCVYIVYDPFGKKLPPARFGLPSERLKPPHDSTSDSENNESSGKTPPRYEMLQPASQVATRDELRRHVQNYLVQFPDQPYVYVVQKVVRRQFGQPDAVVRAVALKIENPTFDRRRLRHFRIGGCS